MDTGEEWGCGEAAVSIFVSIEHRKKKCLVVGLPCEGVDHPTTRGHDTGSREKHAHERETTTLASTSTTTP